MHTDDNFEYILEVLKSNHHLTSLNYEQDFVYGENVYLSRPAVVLRMHGPTSATVEEVYKFHMHGLLTVMGFETHTPLYDEIDYLQQHTALRYMHRSRHSNSTMTVCITSVRNFKKINLLSHLFRDAAKFGVESIDATLAPFLT